MGGHDRMVRRYKDICSEFNCDAKVFTQTKNDMESMIGEPDLIILFTNPISHEMAKVARKKALQYSIALEQSHCGSCSALRNILSVHAAAGCSGCKVSSCKKKKNQR
jgi:uncharacterized protein (DUF169 family)